MNKHDRSVLNKVSLKDPWQLIAFGFGSGLAPIAPGTFGSLAALPLCMALVYLPWYVNVLIIMLTFIVGVKACDVADRVLGMHDNSSVVIDEFAGMFISVLFFPSVWYYAFLGFVLFRFFDILKPYPINVLDKKIAGGLGVMVDDVLAGAYACMSAQILFYFLS
ncbi:MAG: phosphatidylglycerophosphatase A [Succinivibrio sp.]|nr:phosphatidylglycerophosphatase A [Succinivibrio sp.]